MVFAYAIASSLTILLIRGIADIYEGRGQANQNALIERLTLLTSRVVKKKLDRFKKEAVKMAAGENPFEKITKPDQQINLLLTEFVDLITSRFELNESELCITIMHLNHSSRKWVYKYETNTEWQHTKPEILLKTKSTASTCLKTGEAIFLPDKERAAKSGKYHLSERDIRNGKVGSVFCYPAFTKIGNGQDKYLISIVTYGTKLCDPLDREQVKAIKIIFCDICRRIDLELTLESIKTMQSTQPIATGDRHE